MFVQKIVSGVNPCLPSCFRQGLSVVFLLRIPGWLALELLRALGVNWLMLYIQLLYGFWGSNSGAQACTASTLPIESSHLPSPLNLFIFECYHRLTNSWFGNFKLLFRLVLDFFL